MVRIQEAILVEGRYDKNSLSQIVDAPIFEAGGFGVFKNRELIALLKTAARERGLIIFTDSDGAGFLIRNRLKSLLAPEKLLHAYIPDIPGKERRKDKQSKEGLLGVEGMTPEVILEALRLCGAHILDGPQTEQEHGSITRQDLFVMGLMGGTGSSAKRNYVKRQLHLPQHLGTGAFLDALNLVTDKAKLEELLQEGPDHNEIFETNGSVWGINLHRTEKPPHCGGGQGTGGH